MAFQFQNITGRKINPNYAKQIAAKSHTIFDTVAEKKKQEMIKNQMAQEAAFNYEQLHQQEKQLSHQKRQDKLANILGVADLASNVYFSDRADKASGGSGILSFLDTGKDKKGEPSLIGPGTGYNKGGGGGKEGASSGQDSLLEYGTQAAGDIASKVAGNVADMYLNKPGTIGNTIKNTGESYLDKIEDFVTKPIDWVKKGGSAIFDAGSNAIDYITDLF